MFAYRRRVSVIRMGETAAGLPFRAPMHATRREARNATNFPTNISTNNATNKPTFFNNVFEGVLRTRQDDTLQRDTLWDRRCSGVRMLKNVGFLARPGAGTPLDRGSTITMPRIRKGGELIGCNGCGEKAQDVSSDGENVQKAAGACR